MLQVKNLKKAFGELKVLTDINLEVADGEIVCVQGRSGEGKTTLLRLLNGLETKDGGTISVDGSVGMVFQDYQLFPHLSVWENLTLAPKLQKELSDEEIELRGDELLQSLGLTDKKFYYPYQLSGGQKQRVAVARACMLAPKLLCFDEPTAALDEESIEDMIKMIRKLAATGMSILIITHDPIFAGKVGDRILYLKRGELNIA